MARKRNDDEMGWPETGTTNKNRRHTQIRRPCSCFVVLILLFFAADISLWLLGNTKNGAWSHHLALGRVANMIVETYSQIHSNVFYSNLPLYPAESILPSREVCSTLAEEWIKDFSVRRNLGSDENKVVVFYNNHKWEDTTYIPWLLHPRKIEKIHIDWRSPESYMTYPSKAANLKSPFMVVVNRIADALEEVILSVPPRVFFHSR
mmetsp:Transcript_32553/g.40052  ORF Transcript_32553/g.40052 Transcript_32553/m.40052 type:complete len:206 (-) Transcript_32553:3-620(-)